MVNKDDLAFMRYQGQHIYNSGSGGQDYGPRTLEGKYDFHHGIDFGVSGRAGVPIGVPEIFDGWTCHVVHNNHRDGLGNQVILISQDGKKMAKFGHIADNSLNHLKDGQIVHTGDWIGDVGGTGLSKTGDDWRPHIHFEYGYNPKYQHVVRARNKKTGEEFDCDYHQWVFGDENNKDRVNPETILTQDMVERATQMAIDNKKAHLTGQAPSRGMASTNLKKGKGEGVSFASWFKTTWLGKLFLGSEDERNAAQATQNPNVERTQAGATIHRKNAPQAVQAQQPTSAQALKLSCVSQEQYQDMLKHGISPEAIMKLDQTLAQQIAQQKPGLIGALNQVSINCSEVCEDKTMAAKLQNYIKTSNFSVRR